MYFYRPNSFSLHTVHIQYYMSSTQYTYTVNSLVIKYVPFMEMVHIVESTVSLDIIAAQIAYREAYGGRTGLKRVITELGHECEQL